MRGAISAGESIDLKNVRANAFPFLTPTYLPEATMIVSGRWWGGGEVVEIHTRTAVPELVSGRLTIKQWTERAEQSTGMVGRDAAARTRRIAGERWFISSADDGPMMMEGRVGNINVQVLSLFSEEETSQVVASLQH